MKRYYATKKRIKDYIEVTLKKFDSLESFREELILEIKDLDNGSNLNQVRFYRKVLAELG